MMFTKMEYFDGRFCSLIPCFDLNELGSCTSICKYEVLYFTSKTEFLYFHLHEN